MKFPSKLFSVIILMFSYNSLLYGLGLQPKLILPKEKIKTIKSMEFRDMNIKDVFRSIAELGEINIILDSQVNGTVTFSFHDISTEDALNSLFQSENLNFAWDKDTLNIYQGPQTTLKPDQEASSTEILVFPDNQNPRVRSLNLRDTDVRDAIRTITSLASINTIINQNVEGCLNVNFNDIKIEDALNAILHSQCLTFKWFGNILLIKPIPNLKNRETITLRNKKVKELYDVLDEMRSEIGTYSINVASNSITLTDRKETLKATIFFLRMLDTSFATVGESAIGETRFINFTDNKLVLGSNVLTIKINESKNSSESTSLGLYLNFPYRVNETKIAEYSYDSMELGSGTAHKVIIRCNIGLSISDKETGCEIQITPRK